MSAIDSIWSNKSDNFSKSHTKVVSWLVIGSFFYIQLFVLDFEVKVVNKKFQKIILNLRLEIIGKFIRIGLEEISPKFVGEYHAYLLYLVIKVNVGDEVGKGWLLDIKGYYFWRSYEVLDNDIGIFNDLYWVLLDMMVDSLSFKQEFW